MESLKNILNKFIKYRDENHKLDFIKSKELAIIACMMIKEKFMILPSTKKNKEFVDSLREVYKDINIYDKNRDNDYSLIKNNTKCSSLEEYLRLSFQDNSNINTIFNDLSNRHIIIEKNNKLQEYIDIVKVTNVLSNNKKFVLKNISFFTNNCSNMFFNFSDISLIRKINKYYKKQTNNNANLRYIFINKNSSFETFVDIKKDLPYQVDLSFMESSKDARNRKIEFKKEITDYVKENIPFGEYNVKVKNIELHLPINYKNKKYPLRNLSQVYCRYVDDINVAELHSGVLINKIPFKEIEKIIEEAIFKN